jgi:hypothetical protein
MSNLDKNALEVFLQLAGSPGGSACQLTEHAQPAINNLDEVKRERNHVRALLERSAGSDGLPVYELFRLQRSLRIAAEMGRAPGDSCDILFEIVDAVRQAKFVAPFSEQQTWTEAIASARRARNCRGFALSHPIAFSRQIAVAGAALRLASQGFQSTVDAYGLSLNPDAFTGVCRRIEEAVVRLGGRKVAENILFCLMRNGRTYEGSFLHGRAVQQAALSQRFPSVPWHYLYNLALKHLDGVPSSSQPNKDWTDAVELARDMAATLDVEVYGTYENMDIAPTNLHGVLLDNVLYDELFAFPQWQPKHAVSLFSSWLGFLTEEGCALPGGSVVEWRALSQSLLSRAQPYKFEITCPAEHVSRDLTCAVASRLMHSLAIPAANLNQGYSTPRDTAQENRNSLYYPLFEITKDLFLIPPRCLAARALYERLYSLMCEAGPRNKKQDGELENKIARALEKLAAQAIRLAGHVPVSGKYVDPDTCIEYDVDLAVETAERVFLIECKKKALTNKARAGETLNAITDLTASNSKLR